MLIVNQLNDLSGFGIWQHWHAEFFSSGVINGDNSSPSSSFVLNESRDTENQEEKKD